MTAPDETPPPETAAAAATAVQEPATEPAPKRDLAQLWVCGFLTLLGVLVIVDASRLGGFTASNDPIGPKPVPIILGILLFAVAACYTLDTLRGGRGEADHRDGDAAFDWRTLGLLCAVFIANALLIDWLGWVVSGALLFWGAAIVLGSRRYLTTLAAAVALGLATFYGFAIGLGVGLPAGVLQGIL
ncbi:tripartite tricarboxylate transporter TctB family protein [Glycomyces sp. TRM65418]|uniref:tripartite tricarboxylate transporter TctB family protein n=1 Tax=Glycomyces sp. TRM65418 TaxID=2867006 RepID=UPI001CE6465E|nr:tripartite tricarboxylate transporter TctB family protein [Glycomyces sp. TRM65418]MCC3764157.1 tripartite tricarboxylate transporter TctB family protein [Glycomyces sp. TRM65418]QZD53842.1 tripartite tricarboxylate transporter TctB family protein [Glycomyces sp. TRM65418]